MGQSCSRSIDIEESCNRQNDFSWIMPYVSDIEVTEIGILNLILNKDNLPVKQIPETPIFIEAKEFIKRKTSFFQTLFGENGHQQEMQKSSHVITSFTERTLDRRSFIVRITPQTNNTIYIRYMEGAISVGRSNNPNEIEWELTNFISNRRYDHSKLESNSMLFTSTTDGSVVAQAEDMDENMSEFVLLLDRRDFSFRMQLTDERYEDRQLFWKAPSNVMYQRTRRDDERYNFDFYLKAQCVIRTRSIV